MLLKKTTTTTTRKMGVLIAKDGTPIYYNPQDPKSELKAKVALAKINARHIQGTFPKIRLRPKRPKGLRRL